MKKVIGIVAVVLAFASVSLAGKHNAVVPNDTANVCQGETIDTFGVAFPTPYVGRDQKGIIAIDVQNKDDASLGLFGCPASNISVVIYKQGADGNPDMNNPLMLASGFDLQPGEQKLMFTTIDPTNLDPTITYAQTLVQVRGTDSSGQSFESNKNVYFGVEAQ